MVVHERVAQWLVPHFAALAIVQVIDAQIRADPYGELIGGVPNASPHPRSGFRRDHNDMLNVIAADYYPAGKESSRWTSSGEFQKAMAQLQQAGLFGNADETGLCTEVAFGADTALITARSEEPHAQLGHGVLLRLSLPATLSATAAATLALYLNSAEASTLLSAHMLGAWCSAELGDKHIPVFISFVPNVLFGPRLLFNLVLSPNMKAQWAYEQIGRVAKDRLETSFDAQCLKQSGTPEPGASPVEEPLEAGEPTAPDEEIGIFERMAETCRPTGPAWRSTRAH